MTKARADDVGPILVAGEVGAAIVQALEALNPGLRVTDRGSYLRALAPGRCVLTRAAAEHALGRPFRLPTDLEAVMPSFAGRLSIDENEVRWTA